MSKYVRVNDTNYKLTVNSGGTITLDTGVESGEVVITGNLLVKGTTTTIQTQNLEIEDNLIVLNKGETGAGVSEVISGITIDRGSKVDAQMVFDESVNWVDSAGQATTGLFVFREDNTGKLLGIQTNSITTNGNDLVLIGSGNNVVSVTGTVDYEDSVIDDDHIPNKKYVDRAITTYLESPVINNIAEVNPNPSITTVTKLEINHAAENSSLTLTLNDELAAQWLLTRFSVQKIRIVDTNIFSTATDTDLVLSSPGTGSVAVNDSLKLITLAADPGLDANGVKLYAKPQGRGGTGVFFVNSLNTKDELVSARKALAYSLIF